LLTLRNILYGSVLDAVGLGNHNLLLTTLKIVDVVLSGVLLWSGALSGEVASMTVVDTDAAGGGSSDLWRRQEQHMWWWG
jgi:hypothetical protein